MRDESPAMRELALVVLCEMVKASSLGGPAQNGSIPPFEPFINITLARVIEVFRDKDNAHVKQVRQKKKTKGRRGEAERRGGEGRRRRGREGRRSGEGRKRDKRRDLRKGRDSEVILYCRQRRMQWKIC